MSELELVFVSKKTFGKYTGTLEWYVKDNIWIDNCFKSTITDKAGKIIEIIDKIRPVPEKIKPDQIVPQPIEGEPPIEGTGKLWYFDPTFLSELYVFSPPLKVPITAWVIEVNDDVLIFDAETGKNIGRKRINYTSARALDPSCGGTSPTAIKEWFPKLGFPIAHEIGCYPDEVKRVLRDDNTKYWYCQGHGSASSNDCGNFYTEDVEEGLANRTAMWVAILDCCSSVKNTGPGTLSYAFRKGLMKGTVTMGLIRESAMAGDWFNVLFDRVYNGSTWKDGFDYACAAEPFYGNACGFCGDEGMKLVGGGGPTPPPTNDKMCKDEFPAEVRKRGTIAISEIPTTGNAQDRWLCMDGYLNYWVSEPDINVMAFYTLPGRITSVCFIIGDSDVDCIPMGIALEMINKLPFGVAPPTKSYIETSSSPSAASIWLRKH